MFMSDTQQGYKRSAAFHKVLSAKRGDRVVIHLEIIPAVCRFSTASLVMRNVAIVFCYIRVLHRMGQRHSAFDFGIDGSGIPLWACVVLSGHFLGGGGGGAVGEQFGGGFGGAGVKF